MLPGALLLVLASGCDNAESTDDKGITTAMCGQTSMGGGALVMSHADFTGGETGTVPANAQHVIAFYGDRVPDCLSPFSQQDCDGTYEDVLIPPELFVVGTFDFTAPGVVVTSSKPHYDKCSCTVQKDPISEGQLEITAISDTEVGFIVSGVTGWMVGEGWEHTADRCPGSN